MRLKQLLTVVTLLLAAAQFARCYMTMSFSFLNLKAYAAGAERMPFQGRMLMMYPLRWAGHSQRLINMANGRDGALHTPEMILLTALTFVCICLTAVLVTVFYLRVSRRREFVWMPAALLLVVCAVQYILHLQNAMYPYDMLSLLLFNVGLYLIYIRQAWWLVVLFPLVTLNREVSLFLIVLLVLDAWAEQGWRGWLRAQFLVQCAAMSAMWIGLRIYVQHRFAANPKEPGGHMQKNMNDLMFLQFWPQIACLGAFLIPILFVYRRQILDARVRAYLWVILPWLVCMFIFGELIETRVMGELSVLIALAAVLELEERSMLRA